MPPPYDGNEYLPWADLIKVKKLDDFTYQSVALPFSPGGQTPGAKDRAYGGHVYAQAAWAASHTVAQGLVLYNAVGSFLLPGHNRLPFIYRVQKIRDGRSFSTRIVNVTQGESPDICFTSLISFKGPEISRLDAQEQVNLWEEYSIVLQGKTPSDFPECPGMDVPWYLKLRKETGQNDQFPGLEVTKVDMTPFNENKHPFDRRGLMFYRASGSLPPDPNLHLCAHLYASDRNSLYIVANNMDVGDVFTQMSTLVHMTAFHSSTDLLMFGPSEKDINPMDDTGSQGRWFAKEDWTTRTEGGRSMFHGRLWAPDGTQVATLTQDGLIRYTKKAEPTDDELATLRERQSGWKRREKL